MVQITFKILDSFSGLHGIDYYLGKSMVSGIYFVATQSGILRKFKEKKEAIDLYMLYWTYYNIDV